jgi:hypothetical protein
MGLKESRGFGSFSEPAGRCGMARKKQDDYYGHNESWIKTIVLFVAGVAVVALCVAAIWGFTGAPAD